MVWCCGVVYFGRSIVCSNEIWWLGARSLMKDNIQTTESAENTHTHIQQTITTRLTHCCVLHMPLFVEYNTDMYVNAMY